MPRCACCKETRPVHDFNIERARPSGCQAYCRQCARQKTREAMDRRRACPLYRREQVEQKVAAYATDPDHRARAMARSRARHALLRGELQKAPCRCGTPRAEMHHEDYSKPLEVTWLCRACHLLEHHGPDFLEVTDSGEDPIADLLRKRDARRLRKAIPRNETSNGESADLSRPSSTSASG